MIAALFCLIGLFSFGLARPSSSDEVQELARNYAELHPNTESEPRADSGEYFEGDILTEDDDILVNPLNAIRDPNRLWPNAIAYYAIANGQYTSSQVNQIEQGIRQIQELTRVNGQLCIRIEPRTSQTNYVSIENYSGCSSYIGRIGGRQRMSLVNGCFGVGIVMHEWLHAFGFYHEQGRTDRDSFVTINWSNIQPGYENNFNKYTQTQINHLGTPYDYGSVMHYGAYDFAIDRSVPTIIPTDPRASIGQRTTLSRWDIERVQILYGCIRAEDSVYFKDYTPEQLQNLL
jgi:hypothetical protein